MSLRRTSQIVTAITDEVTQLNFDRKASQLRKGREQKLGGIVPGLAIDWSNSRFGDDGWLDKVWSAMWPLKYSESGWRLSGASAAPEFTLGTLGVA
jgi:hypothetical protein